MWIELSDSQGVVEMLDDDNVSVEVTGAGRLAALGSASPTADSSFTGASTTLHYGRALAIVRSTGETGPVTVTATSTSHGSATIALAAL